MTIGELPKVIEAPPGCFEEAPVKKEEEAEEEEEEEAEAKAGVIEVVDVVFMT